MKPFNDAKRNLFLEKLQGMFQCGSTTDVQDDFTTQDTEQQADEIPGLEDAQSSSSSIYVVPSREALEEMVRESHSTKRQGLFDMDRLFSCGSTESVLHEGEQLSPHELIRAVTDDAKDDATIASVFSRSAPRNESHTSLASQCTVKTSTTGHLNPKPILEEGSYRIRIRMSAAPQERIFRPCSHDSDDESSQISLRRAVSESMHAGLPPLHNGARTLPRLSSPPPPISRSSSISSE